MPRSLGESGLLTVLGKVASIVRVERMGEEARYECTSLVFRNVQGYPSGIDNMSTVLSCTPKFFQGDAICKPLTLRESKS